MAGTRIRRRHKGIALVSAPLVGLAGFGTVAVVNAAAAGADTCNYTIDCTPPQNQVAGCSQAAQNDAVTELPSTASGRYEEMRYSAFCHTVWARINKVDQGWFSSIYVQRVTPPGLAGKASLQWGNTQKVWTVQLNDNGLISRVCGVHSGAAFCVGNW
jgi:hypothetical protein